MKRLTLLTLPFLAAVLLGGCGEPAPSTALAPDKPLPDTTKMSDEEIQRLHGGGSSTAPDRGNTPADRGG